MDERLYKAAIKGDVISLLSLIQEDALILHRNNTTEMFLETPLHITAMLGYEQFAVELLKLSPHLVQERDSQGSSPLHLASAKGNLPIVKACLKVSQDVCFSRNMDGKNPVHVAAMRGRVDVLGEFLRVKPEAGRAILDREKQTILHLCVKCGQLQALQFLVGSGIFEDMVNWKDKNGNTILHVAVADKQVETTNFLLDIAAIEVNALNQNGMTPMDILMQRGRDIRDLEIEESLLRSRAKITKENNLTQGNASYEHDSSLIPTKYKMAKKSTKQNGDWVERKKSALMVVASLIATMAFQVGVSPPKKYENDPNVVAQQGDNVTDPDFVFRFMRFYITNTTSLVASLSIILLLMSGLPIKNRFFMWILMVVTWVAISTLALSYTYSVVLSAPKLDATENSIIKVVKITFLVWAGLMILILITHAIRFIVKMVKWMIKRVSTKRSVVLGRGHV